MVVNLTRRIALLALMFVLAIGGAYAQPGDGRGPGTGRGDGSGNGRPPADNGDPGKGRGPADGRDPGNGGGGAHDAFVRCLGTLELTREQRAEIARLQAAGAEFEATTKREIAALEARLATARRDGDREAAAAILAEIRAKKEALRGAGERVHNAIVALLTPEQQAALRECMQPKGRDRDRDLGRDCFAKIDLTREQMAEIQALREAFRASQAALHAELRDLHAQLREARRNGDTALVERLRNAINEKMVPLKAAHERLHNAILGVLTPEQQEALRECESGLDNGRGRRGMMMPQHQGAPTLR